MVFKIHSGIVKKFAVFFVVLMMAIAFSSPSLYALTPSMRRIVDSGSLYFNEEDYLICNNSTGRTVSGASATGVAISPVSGGGGNIVTEAEIIANPFTAAERGTITPQAIVLHWTTGEYVNGQEVADTLRSRTEPQWPIGRALQLSVDKAGKIWQLSETLETRPAQTFPGGAADPWNDTTIGIEIESGFFGDDIPAYEQDLLDNTVQYNKVLSLIRGLMEEYGIQNVRDASQRSGVFGHLEINPGNSDPGPNYMESIRNDLGTPIGTPSEPGQATGCRCTVPGAQSNLSTGNRTFFIGDSLMNGMYYGDDPDGPNSLLNQASVAGLAVDVNANTTLNASGGLIRSSGISIEARGGENIDGMIEYLNEHPQDFSTENADIIVVGLGTNYYGRDRGLQIRDFIGYLRGYNPTAQIYWINTKFNVSDPSISYQAINAEIDDAASELNFNVIDYATAVSLDSSIGPPTSGSDQIHLSWDGNIKKSAFVISQLTGSANYVGGPSSVCGAVPSSGNNELDVWNLLTQTHALTPQQAAGIIGNMRHESGVQPMRLQGTPSGVETPSSTVNIAGTSGIGWGLVQWTPTSKIIQESFNRGQAYDLIDTIGYQLDFLMGQLRGTGIGGDVSSERTRAGVPFFATTNERDAASVFAIDYERCQYCQAGTAEVRSRMDAAVDVLTQYGSGGQ